ncbi:TadE/TadG family type IV pilus assembly protein [Enterovirga aerilata]|uniref:Pilus assembly protein n=1 Tax=Enterovirga aerilata TaxID=2730920 RepID=A0A849IC06_9HYPH|nr:TadE/TadG family type IV pilus assembly protein [Enterovirga sp. DB1703]NNM74938.1 pilus assembly protein [Enterovirga sp. DB1703]
MSLPALPVRLAPARLRRAAGPLAARLAALHSSVAGVAAVEFALVLPVMVTMLLGMSEVTLAVNVDRKLTLLSRSLADLSSRVQTITTSELDDIFKASSIVLQPFSVPGLRMVVSQMYVEQVSGTVYRQSVNWSCARGTGATAKPLNVYESTVPSGFQTDKSYYMLIDVALPYTPMFGKAITGTITLAESTPWPIRNNTKVTLSGGCPSST